MYVCSDQGAPRIGFPIGFPSKPAFPPVGCEFGISPLKSGRTKGVHHLEKSANHTPKQQTSTDVENPSRTPPRPLLFPSPPKVFSRLPRQTPKPIYMKVPVPSEPLPPRHVKVPLPVPGEAPAPVIHYKRRGKRPIRTDRAPCRG